MSDGGPRYLGIDVGTSLVKAAIIDDDGDVQAVASRPLTLNHPFPGRVEQDIDEIWMASVTSSIGHVSRTAPNASRWSP